MQSQLLKIADSTCMLVEIIAKKSQDIKWIVSLDGEQISNDKIRRVSIDKFYELVTGRQDSFKKLCLILPLVIEDIVNSIDEEIMQNSVFKELSKISPNILQSLYLLSFVKYEGFDNFAIID